MSIAEKFEIIADAVYDKGKQSEYDAFWDKFQQSGNRRSYAYGIGGLGWTKETFKPKYDLIAKESATFMFCASAIKGNLGEILNDLGIRLDTTGCKAMTYMFRTSQFTTLPTIDCRACANISYIFANMTYLTTIEKWILPTTSSQNFASAFLSTDKLTDINEIEGTFIASVDFKDCPLSTASIVNIIEHLSDSQSATLTLKESAKESMTFPYTSPQTNTTYNSWDDLVDTKPDWTISLV